LERDAKEKISVEGLYLDHKISDWPNSAAVGHTEGFSGWMVFRLVSVQRGTPFFCRKHPDCNTLPLEGDSSKFNLTIMSKYI